MANGYIMIQNAHEHNLKHIDLTLEKGRFIVVTGVSGSGKSSLIYNTIYKEAERLYFASFPSWSRKYLGVVSKPKVDSITGLDAAIVVDQKNSSSSVRSTVGTFSGVYDVLRLLFARFGLVPPELRGKKELFNSAGTLTRSLFSFNSETGACPVCKGLGVEDYLDPLLIVDDWSKSIRDRALKITAPNGYIIYSQVTLEVLDTVCRAHGFSIDTPLSELDEEQRKALFFGSKKLLVPFGKHTLESRMKWTGITAKPREEGFYPGFITVMSDILKRDRNPNVLRFVRSVPCSACHGARLRPEALSVTYAGKTIVMLAEFPLYTLSAFLRGVKPQHEGEAALLAELLRMLEPLIAVGLGHISLARQASGLSGGEMQRIKIASLAQNRLRGVLYIFDEPTVGLHRAEAQAVVTLLKALRDKGNTVIAVEHDTDTMLQADTIIETGPVGGSGGGHILFSGSVSDFLQNGATLGSPTWHALTGARRLAIQKEFTGELAVKNASRNNLKNLTVSFKKGAINVITGLSGSGKRSLMQEMLQQCSDSGLTCAVIDRAPIGKTPRSNPATYTGIADKLRDLFASLEESKTRGLTKSHFSFNSGGGRCEVCEGAGVREIGMKYLGSVEVQCEHCHGKRFNQLVLNVRYNGKTIADIYEMTVSGALQFFKDTAGIAKSLTIMAHIGLSYLTLGQTTSSLSGGEAQRVRLAAHLAKTKAAGVLFFEEPTTGLHPHDIAQLIHELCRLTQQGNTVIAIEHDPDFIAGADHLIELGPQSGSRGGELLYAGSVQGLIAGYTTPTAQVMRDYLSNQGVKKALEAVREQPQAESRELTVEGITTHNLKNIHLRLTSGTFTVITGVSGSGKTSLAFDTLFSEAFRAFLEGTSPYIRSMLRGGSDCRIERSDSLMPPVAVSHRFTALSPRSTAGTVSGIYELLRMLYSRAGVLPDTTECSYTAGDFSFNSEAGACPRCTGTGTILEADSRLFITDPSKSFFEGAMNGTKQGRFYGDPNGQYLHALQTVGSVQGLDFSKPVQALTEKERAVALYGTGETVYAVDWHYVRGRVTGTHHFSGVWKGFAGLLTDEYYRSIGNKNEQELKKLMKEEQCPACGGKRLKPELLRVTFAGKSIAEAGAMEAAELHCFLSQPPALTRKQQLVYEALAPELLQLLERMLRLGLGHIATDRATATLSLGERERLKLVKNSVNGLQNILYILDEPSRGLHQADCQNLVETLKELAAQGNTVVAVEHEPSIIAAAEQVIELGPGAGEQGGAIIFSGTVEELKHAGTPTSAALCCTLTVSESSAAEQITFAGATARNLKNIDVSLPLGKITIITGVSGSGKTTLLQEVIAASLASGKAVNCREIDNLPPQSHLFFHENKVSAPSGGHSITATYTGLFEIIRKQFADSPQAKALGLKSTHFSLNGEGVCPVCSGAGTITIPMDFLADSTAACTECEGRGFLPTVLAITVHGRNIADILAMSISQARQFFSEDKKMGPVLAALSDCGLDYLTLGQPVAACSSGEIQRLDLAITLHRFSQKKNSGHLFFLFDEPSTGLHHADIAKLLTIFDRLTKTGHTVIVADHRLQLAAHAHHLIDLGPGCGHNGGSIIFSGSPKALIEHGTGKTAKALREIV